MSTINAPAGGLVQPLSVLAELGVGDAQGVVVVPVPEHALAKPEVAVVAPVAGTVTEVTTGGFAVAPTPESPPVPSCRLVVVHVVGGLRDLDRDVQVAVGEEVASGQPVLRWRSTEEDDHVIAVEVVDPEGEVLCELLEQEVYTAEPLLTVLGPRADQLPAVVAIEKDGSVTPHDTQEASDLTAAGESPAQHLKEAREG